VGPALIDPETGRARRFAYPPNLVVVDGGAPQVAAAAAALADARRDAPQSSDTWLLSATLSRRQGKLAEAQAEIETGAALAPADPAIGLEAGVIAALSGRDEAARQSFNSVISLAPQSPQAATARGYLAQLGEVQPAR
jgi:Flp pilus assembly protein TadD